MALCFFYTYKYFNNKVIDILAKLLYYADLTENKTN